MTHRLSDILSKYQSTPGSAGGPATAANVSYSNTSSGLSAVEVQAAIDELASLSGSSAQNAIDFNRVTITTNTTLAINSNVYQHIISNTASLLVDLPSNPVNGTHFIIKNSTSSSESFTTNSVVVLSGELYEVKYDGTEWVEL